MEASIASMWTFFAGAGGGLLFGIVRNIYKAGKQATRIATTDMLLAYQTIKTCEDCRVLIASRICKVEENVKENEKILTGINNNVLKILEKLSNFTESFKVVKENMTESNKQIDEMKNNITELQTIERIRNGSFIKE